jgi:hypothetical protein
MDIEAVASVVAIEAVAAVDSPPIEAVVVPDTLAIEPVAAAEALADRKVENCP